MSIELRIRNMMNENRDPLEIVDAMLNLSANSRISSQDLKSIAQYLILSGHHREYFRQFPRRFFEKKNITWPHFVEILLQQKVELNNKWIHAIYEGAEETRSLESLSLNFKWSIYDNRMVPVREELWKKMYSQLEIIKKKMIQKIHYLQSQRIISEEKKAFQKFLNMFPEDTSLKPLYDEFKEREARAIVNKKIEEKKYKEIPNIEVESLTQGEEELAKVILKECIELSRRHSSLVYDFAIMFLEFEYFQGAIELMKLIQAPSSLRNESLKIEVLYVSENYYDLLSHIEELEKHFSHEVDFSFGLVYYKALCYHKLNQKAAAVALLNGLLKIRPDYRSASTLLNQILEEKS